MIVTSPGPTPLVLAEGFTFLAEISQGTEGLGAVRDPSWVGNLSMHRKQYVRAPGAPGPRPLVWTDGPHREVYGQLSL